MPDYLQVSGTLSPDATGIYAVGTDYGGVPSYAREDNGWFIWWYNSIYVLSREVGVATPPFWYRSGDIEGEYTPSGPPDVNTGTATVAAYVAPATAPVIKDVSQVGNLFDLQKFKFVTLKFPRLRKAKRV